MSDQLNEKKFTCIMCPLGCEVTVKSDANGQITAVLGNKCAKGDEYARDEFTHPLRILTSTVAIEGAIAERLPVRTSKPIPKDRIFDAMDEMRKICAKTPLKLGDKVIENLLGLGMDVIATRDM